MYIVGFTTFILFFEFRFTKFSFETKKATLKNGVAFLLPKNEVMK